MDVGSTKGDVIEAARRGLRDQLGSFVPAHPIAGKEVAGVEHADADLYTGRQVVLTPIKATLRSNVQRATQVWTGIGAKVRDDDARGARQRLRRRQPPAAPAGLRLHQRRSPPSPRASASWSWPARAFATSRASPPATRPCGATSCWPTASRCCCSRRPSAQALAQLEALMSAGNAAGPGGRDRRRQPHPRANGSRARPRRPTDRCSPPPSSTFRRSRRPAAPSACPAPRASPTACCCWRRSPAARPRCTTCSIRTTRA